MRIIFAAVLALAWTGCKEQQSALENTGPPIQSSLTWWRDVKPIVDDKCINCHVDGGIAPFALTDYATAASHGFEIRAAVAARLMPPWLAGPGCNEYLYDRSLTDDQIATITGWVDQGNIEGDPATYVAPQPTATGGISRIDRQLMMPTMYTPKLSPDEYRCFILDWPETTDKFVTGFRADPGNKAIVHHVIAYLASDPSDIAAYQKLDDADPDPGYICFGGPGGATQGGEWIGSWAPGAPGYDTPAGTGIRIPAGSKIVLQVHYNTASTLAAPDRTGISLKIDDQVQKEAFEVPWTNISWVLNHTMDIPAGKSDVPQIFDDDPTQYLAYLTNGTFAPSTPVTIWSTMIHMHTHGTRGHVSIKRAGGDDECLLDVPRWDFHWQGGYALTQPVTFNPGDQIHLECHFDNATGTKDLNWGEGTGDEMCLTGFYITQ
jgi:hypothetical protein